MWDIFFAALKKKFFYLQPHQRQLYNSALKTVVAVCYLTNLHM